MEQIFTEMNAIFQRTKTALSEFSELITPIIENATDEHERLYWHHIYEEEDHRSDRLDLLLPNIGKYLDKSMNSSDYQIEFIHLLQDISLEKFGLHNFLEHLDLSLFQFRGTEFEDQVQSMRDFTSDDYQRMKVIMDLLNQEFKGENNFKTSIPTDEKEGTAANLKIEAYTSEDLSIHQQPIIITKKGLTVGSLKQL